MLSLAMLQDFITAAESARSLAEIELLMEIITRQLGFEYYALVQHIDLSNRMNGEMIAMSNYPDAWIESFVARQFVGQDPVHLASHRVNIGFSWDRTSEFIPETSTHRRIRRLARHAGVDRGFTVPANIPGEATGSCSFATRPGQLLPEQNFPMAHVIGAHAFHAARRLISGGRRRSGSLVKLAPRHLECLVYAGRGTPDASTGQALGIAEDTVRGYIDEVRNRFDVNRRIQAVVLALIHGHITLSDLAKFPPVEGEADNLGI